MGRCSGDVFNGREECRMASGGLMGFYLTYMDL